MFPDQNQPQPQNDPAVAGPSPVYDTPPVPVSPVPFEPAPASPQPMTSQPADPMQPAPPAPEPVAFSPATPAAEPVAAPMGPMGDPLAPQPAPAPVAAPVVDSSQLGYVPPAMPMNPAGMAPMSANTGKAKGGKFAKIRVIVAVVVGLAVFSGAGILLKDLLFTGSQIKISDLVPETEAGITFKRPKDWAKSSKIIGSADAVYTEQGKPLEETDQSLQIVSEDLPFDLGDLTQTQSDQLIKELKDQMSESSEYEDMGCKNPTNIQASEKTLAGYKLGVQSEATCSGYAGRSVTLKIKIVTVGVGAKAHTVAIFALDKSWDKSGKAFDEILNTFKPAE